jgi:hypothetical protein
VKVLVFVDHDIICRHFVMSGALAPLVQAADVKFVFPDAGCKRVKLDPATLPLNAPFERIPVDASRVQYWRWALFVDQMRLRFGAAERAIRRARWLTLGWKSGLLLTVAGLPGIRPIFLRWVRRKIDERPPTALSSLLDRETPDLVLHPSVLEGLFINDLVSECEPRNVPLVVAMNSWDNPSTKRAVVGSPDLLLVWGPQTHAHAVRFMGIPPERILSFGAAQFDVFHEKPRIDRAAFAAAHDIDPSTQVVLFAGSNAQTDEFAVLSELDRLIEAGALPRMSIVYRPHPWGGGGRDGARMAASSWRHIRIHQPMLKYIEALARGDNRITLPDYRDTHDLLCVVDVVVSPLSTILVEATLHGKPAVVFAPRGEQSSRIMVANLPMLHFDEFISCPDVAYAETVSTLAAILRRLNDPAVRADTGARLQLASRRFVTPFDRPWRDRIVDLLRGMAKTRAVARLEAADHITVAS